MPQKNDAKDIVTIYSPTGKEVTGPRANALDMVRHDGYTWNQNAASEDAPEQAPAETPVEPEKEEAPAEPAAEEAAPEAEEDHTELGDEVPADLADEAKTVADYDSVEDYLNTFDASALRTILEEKFGQTADGRTGKAKLIKKIIEANDEVGGEAL